MAAAAQVSRNQITFGPKQDGYLLVETYDDGSCTIKSVTGGKVVATYKNVTNKQLRIAGAVLRGAQD